MNLHKAGRDSVYYLHRSIKHRDPRYHPREAIRLQNMARVDRYYIAPGLRRSDPWRYVAADRGGLKRVWLFEYPPKRVQQVVEATVSRWVADSGEALSVDDAELKRIVRARLYPMRDLPDDLASRYGDRWRWAAASAFDGLMLFEDRPRRRREIVQRPSKQITWEPIRGRSARMPFHPSGVDAGHVYELSWFYDDRAAAIPKAERGDVVALRGNDPTNGEHDANTWPEVLPLWA